MTATPSIVIIGAGFAGLGMALELQRAGIDNFTIVEKAADLGGVWRENTYPGAACDVPSPLYSWSFEPKSDWPRRFSQQRDIHAYMRAVAEARSAAQDPLRHRGHRRGIRSGPRRLAGAHRGR